MSEIKRETKDIVREKQYVDSKNLDARSKFNNDLPRLGCDAFLYLGELVTKLSLLGEGHVAEIGCGTGVFWDKNPALLKECKSLILTDYSTGMLDKIRSKKWYQDSLPKEIILPDPHSINEIHGGKMSREEIEAIIEKEWEKHKLEILRESKIKSFQMDASKPNDNFKGPMDLILASFMLYELQTREAIDACLINVVKQLRPKTGTFVAMTMDEKVHMKELYELLDETKTELMSQDIDVKFKVPTSAPAIQAFCAGNALEQLRKHFRHIDVYEIPSCIIIQQNLPNTKLTGAQCIVGYLKSLEFIQRTEANGEIDSKFFSELEKVCTRRILFAGRGGLKVNRLDLVYVCYNDS